MVTLKDSPLKRNPSLQRNSSYLSSKGWLAIKTELFKKAENFIHSLEEKLSPPPSVLCCYDFLVTKDKALKLIEINTNASGFLWINKLNQIHKIEQFQKAKENLFLSFLSEFQKISGHRNLKKVSLIDENLLKQKNLKEFYQYKEFFQSFQVDCELLDLKNLKQTHQSDLIYNRTCDFFFEDRKSHILKQMFQNKKICITPNPETYKHLAQKTLMVKWYKEFPELQDILLPCYFLSHIKKTMSKQEIRNWFFKPSSSYGAKGAVSGKSISMKRFESLDENTFLAQKLVIPDKLDAGLKYELRFYTYDKTIQLVGASLYRGQTPRFLSPEEGLIAVKFVE